MVFDVFIVVINVIGNCFVEVVFNCDFVCFYVGVYFMNIVCLEFVLMLCVVCIVEWFGLEVLFLFCSLC